MKKEILDLNPRPEMRYEKETCITTWHIFLVGEDEIIECNYFFVFFYIDFFAKCNEYQNVRPSQVMKYCEAQNME